MNNEEESLLRALRIGGDIAARFQPHLRDSDVIQKRDLSVVTVADFLCQAFINRSLIKASPTIPLMGEEESSLLNHPTQSSFKARVVEWAKEIDPHLGERELLELIDLGNYGGGAEGRFWVIDPIDGTKGYIRKACFAIAIALIDKGKVILGGLDCFAEARGRILVTAKQGEGAKIYSQKDYQPLLMREEESEEIIYCEQTPPAQNHSYTQALDIIKRLGREARPLQADSQCKYAFVATGIATLYLRVPLSSSPEKIWDHAPGALVVQEAGGVVTDLRGNPLDFSLGTTLKNNFGIIATHRKLHPEVVRAVQL